MRLIDNYLAAVQGYLPRGQREDIAAELKGSLYEQLEERSASLRRDLTEAEQAEFLRNLGHPLKVASAYAPQRYLIGPALFPYYALTVRWLAIILASMHAVAIVVVAAVTGDYRISTSGTASLFVANLVGMLAFVTAGFALVERSGRGPAWFERWNPLTLRDRDRYPAVKRGDLIGDVVSDSVGLLWWVGLLVIPARLPWGDLAFPIARGAGWDAIFWPGAFVLAASVALSGVMIGMGSWRLPTAAMKLLLEIASAILVVALLRSPELVRIEGGVGSEVETVHRWLEIGVRWGLGFLLALSLVEIIRYGRMVARLRGMGSL